MPIFKICSPCDINYNLISKTESLNSDINYFLHAVNGSGIGQASASHGSSLFAEYYENDLEYEHQILQLYQAKNISTSLMSDLYDKYYWDFELFGYKIQPFLESNKNK